MNADGSSNAEGLVGCGDRDLVPLSADNVERSDYGKRMLIPLDSLLNSDKFE